MSYRESIDKIIVFLRLLEQFIVSTKMGVLSSVVTFGVGVYTGIYVAQNYEVSKVDDPGKVIENVKKYIEELMKPKS